MRSTLHSPRLFVCELIGVAFFLSACGGGGGDAAESTPASDASATVMASAPVQVADASPASANAKIESVANVQADGYYFDSQGGSDTNNGSFATPWRNLGMLNGVHATVNKAIYLKCNSFWRTNVSLTATQLAPGAGIYSYGTCPSSMPTIAGADNFSGGWTKSGQIWSRKLAAGLGITQVFVNNSALRLARWPNTTGGDGFAITATPATPSNTTLQLSSADTASLKTRDLAGAIVQIRNGGASTASSTTLRLDATSGVLTLGAAAPLTIGANVGFVLQNKLWMLDSPGEFFYDNVAGTLYVWPADLASQTNLNASAVEASVRDTALQIRGTGGTFVRGIALIKARQNGLVIYDAGASTVDGVSATDNGGSGIRVVTSTGAGSNGTVVSNSSVARNAVYGIDATSLANGQIRGNSVTDTGGGVYVGQAQAGIWSGAGTVVESNSVSRSGLSGIRFSGALNSKVTNNIVTDSCLRYSDCGAIYTWNGPSRTGWADGQGATVQGNIVARAPINIVGAGTSPPNFNAAIYLDDYSASVKIIGNTTADTPVGIFVHNSSYNTVASNVIATPSQVGLWANMDSTSTDYLVSNTFSANQIIPANYATGSFPATPTVQPANAVWFWHKMLGKGAITSGSNQFVDNDIVQFNDPTIPVAWVRGPSGDQTLLGAGWVALNPLEHTPRSPAQYALYLPVLGPELVSGGGFDSGLGAWTWWFANSNGSYGHVAAGTLPGCTGTCAVFSPLTIYDNLYSVPFSLTPGALYQFNMTVTFAAAGTASKPGFVNTVTNGGPVISGFSSSSVLNGLAGQTLPYQGTFTATSSSPAKLGLAATGGAVLGFDNVSIRQITNFSTSAIKDWIATAQADKQVLTLNCSTFGWPSGCRMMDVNGVEIGLPYTVPAATAKTVLRMDSPWRTQ